MDDRQIHIVDTPGLFDTNRDMDDVKTEIAKTLLKFPHGIHAFIYVMNAASPRFTEEDQKTLNEIKVCLSFSGFHWANANCG